MITYFHPKSTFQIQNWHFSLFFRLIYFLVPNLKNTEALILHLLCPWKYEIKLLKNRIEEIFKGGFKSEDTEDFFVAKINIPNHYPEQKI